ncbi:hypothetical protein QAD02_011031 [Eretmocerus hayati]|uniref:Uncharacterized protein n=1 Tax=Eretmocerus hayati TaxID=131215 RepID=A0ACC2NVM2_9HYME|nr:hypothetical protein QAD02_011031 [Eretmocerus hayati]
MQSLGVTLLVATLINICNSAAHHDDVNIVSRSEWQAKQPKNVPIKLESNPPNLIVISHTDLAHGGSYCVTKKSCSRMVRKLQTIHQDYQGYDDIAYNFLIGGDGTIYEGRGWDVQGTHTKNFNSKSLGIALIGDFESRPPYAEQVNGLKMFLKYAVEENKLDKGYKLIGQSEVENTNSPGLRVSEIIKKWEHWSVEP